MKEHSCIVPDSYKYKFPYDFVDHVNFKKFNYQGKNIYQCKKCSLIFLKGKNLKKQLDNIYFTKKYSSERKNFHIDSKTIGRQNIPTLKSIAEILIKNINFSALKILDFGCYDGKLLKELSKRVKNCEFHGYDVSAGTKKLFKKNHKFKFWNNLAKIREKFDLITCVNTLPYVSNPKIGLKNMKNLLKKNGKIFFLSVNLSTNPYAISYGDQYQYFTKNNFKNFLMANGLSGKVISNNKSFPRSFIAIVKKTKNKKKYRFLKSEKVSCLIKYLKNVENKIIKFKKMGNNKNIYILGSTVNAVFVFKILKKKKIEINNFVDENPNKINNLFYGKKIVPPTKVKKNSTLIVPYGKTNKDICLRLKKKYDFNFLKI